MWHTATSIVGMLASIATSHERSADTSVHVNIASGLGADPPRYVGAPFKLLHPRLRLPR